MQIFGYYNNIIALYLYFIPMLKTKENKPKDEEAENIGLFCVEEKVGERGDAEPKNISFVNDSVNDLKCYNNNLNDLIGYNNDIEANHLACKDMKAIKYNDIKPETTIQPHHSSEAKARKQSAHSVFINSNANEWYKYLKNLNCSPKIL